MVKATKGGRQTLRERLDHEWGSLTEGLMRLIQGVPVRYRPDPPGVIFLGVSHYQFGELSDDLVRHQHEVKRDYDEWFEVLRLVFRGAPKDLEDQLTSTDETVRKWIELANNFSITQDSADNVASLVQELTEVRGLLELIPKSADAPVIVIPDTNALVETPDPRAYEAIAGSATFSFFLLPTVIREMDNLKHTARDAGYRVKVANAITRIKGWRVQGGLTDGVIVDKTITVQAFAKEPDFSATLHWLDRTNQDDRVVAAALEVQIEHPASVVIIVTSDLNLQNKAEFSRLPYAEAP